MIEIKSSFFVGLKLLTTKRGGKNSGKDRNVLYLDLDYNYMAINIYQKSQFTYVYLCF